MESQTRSPHSSNTKIETLLQNPNNHINKKYNHKKAMKKFEQLILKLTEKIHPNKTLTPAGKTQIQDRLTQLFSQYKSPDHPPYSAMIERAVGTLNEEGGSSKESISMFLEKEYNNLPLAHLMLLEHHLEKLCESGDILLTRGNKYMLVVVG
ncbi:hypothetical protein ACJIZ3_020290 [Penstemon smallii]|uniref:H15 domain-containing protein n=1 Tax=Penstemon smallii TaxID=265156 RepID=A0ABD3SIK8_9LAMI